jgi:hypothetical protein
VKTDRGLTSFNTILSRARRLRGEKRESGS